MSETRRRYSREFKLEAVRRVRESDRPTTEIAEELGLSAEILYRWKREVETDPDQSFPGNGRLADHDKELEELRRENARLQTENTFLKRVSAYFAKGQK